jgi:hypothetical protein
MLTFRLASPDSYRIKFDGVEIGSVSKRVSHLDHQLHWHWGVDTMPLKAKAGHQQSGHMGTCSGGIPFNC